MGKPRERSLVEDPPRGESSGETERETVAVLIVDDSEQDAGLVLRELRRGGFEVSHRRVETRADLVAALEERSWDIVLNDYTLGQVSVSDTVQLVAALGGDVPVLCLSGLAGEEVAVEVLRAGARDFISKDNLRRLCAAVRRELRDRAERQHHAEERRLAETCLRQAQRLDCIGQLSAGIAHEINTPLQFIRDNAHFVQACIEKLTPTLGLLSAVAELPEGAELPSELARALTRACRAARLDAANPGLAEAAAQIQVGVDRISKIVDAMKCLSNPGREDKRTTDLKGLIDTALVMTTSAWKYLAKVEVVLDVSLRPISCLPEAITQVLIHLILNACRAIEEAKADGRGRMGKIEIRARTHDFGTEIAVGDSGVGIAPEQQHEIFNPFFSTGTPPGNRGYGLATVYATVVKDHDGAIELESSTDGGTTFYLLLPHANLIERFGFDPSDSGLLGESIRVASA